MSDTPQQNPSKQQKNSAQVINGRISSLIENGFSDKGANFVRESDNATVSHHDIEYGFDAYWQQNIVTKFRLNG